MFSVVMPAYNAEKFIELSIKSILGQTYKDFEILVIDDGSKDNTKAVVNSFNDKRIKYIYQENSGVSVARNTGITNATGDYVCFLDSDDEWRENHLEELNTLMEQFTNYNVYITGYDLTLNDGTLIHKSQEILKSFPDERFVSKDAYEIMNKNGYFIHTNTVCCKREVFEKVGLFVQGVKNGEDDDMWMRLFAYYDIVISKTATTVYNRANAGATSQRTAVFDNIFCKRIDGILNSSEVPSYRKESLLIWKEENKLSRSRQYILIGKKSEAIKLFKDIEFKKIKKKRYFQTLLCMFIPSKLITKRIDKRDATYYAQNKTGE